MVKIKGNKERYLEDSKVDKVSLQYAVYENQQDQQIKKILED
jgi:hypothetical protein